MSQTEQKFLSLAFIGPANAGKSTLLNAILGFKIASVTPKVQTTRNRIRGVHTEGDCQMLIMDTPGIFRPKTPLEKTMVKTAWGTIKHADLVVMMLDAKKGIDEDVKDIIQGLQDKEIAPYVLINKMDLLKPEQLTELVLELAKIIGKNKGIKAICAKKPKTVAKLLDDLKNFAKDEPWQFDEEEITLESSQFLAEEITREQIFLKTGQEVPYKINVETQKWDDSNPKQLTIHQNIIVMKESQKQIILGKGGLKIKEIGQEARQYAERTFGRKVNLFLFVKVRADWDKHLVLPD